MRTCIATTLALYLGISQGAPEAAVPVSHSEKIANFRNKILGGHMIHRSGLLDGPAEAFEPGPVSSFPAGFDALEGPSALMARWKGQGTLEEYQVAKDKSIYSIRDMLAKEWSGLGLSPEVDEAHDIVAFTAPVDSSQLHAGVDSTQLEALKAMAFKEARKRFRSFQGRLEYENVEVGYVDGKISSVRLRYRRIFKGGIVRKDMSYAYVALDGYGKIRELRVKWPKFSKVGAGIPGVSLEAATDEATRQLEAIPAISNGEETRHPQKANLTGVALSWTPFESGGNILLTPSLSFTSKVDYEGGQVMEPYIDVPLGTKYFK